jgi:hypothetical protein
MRVILWANKLNAHLFGEERVQELYAGLLFLTRAQAWRIARNGLTMTPLLQPQLSISSKLIARANDLFESRQRIREDTKGEVGFTSSHPTRLAPFRRKLHDWLSTMERGTTCTFRVAERALVKAPHIVPRRKSFWRTKASARRKLMYMDQVYFGVFSIAHSV